MRSAKKSAALPFTKWYMSKVTFGADDGRDYALRYVKGAKAAELPPLAAPAPAAQGLDGVPSRYLGVDTDHG